MPNNYFRGHVKKSASQANGKAGMVLNGSQTKKTGRKGDALCSDEKLVLDSTTEQALAERYRTPSRVWEGTHRTSTYQIGRVLELRVAMASEERLRATSSLPFAPSVWPIDLERLSTQPLHPPIYLCLLGPWPPAHPQD